MVKRILGLMALVAGLLVMSAGQAFAAPSDNALPGGVVDLDTLALTTALGDDLFSVVDLTTVLPAADPGNAPDHHFGPFTNQSDPDFGSCNNTWANDTGLQRFFNVGGGAPDGTIKVREQLKFGTFTSNGMNPSPGSCNNGALSNGGMLQSGVTGDTHGYALLFVSGGTFNPSGNPDGPGSCPTTPNLQNASTTNSNCKASTFICLNFTATVPYDPAGAVGFCKAGTPGNPTGAGGVTFKNPTLFFHYNAPNPQSYTPPLTQNEWKDAVKNNTPAQNGDIRNN